MSLLFKYFDLARRVAILKEDRRHFRIGAVGIRRDGVLVASSNGPTPTPNSSVHAEARLCRKLDRGSTIYVVRVDRDENYANARPCISCERIMRVRGVTRVVYTISEHEYGVIDF